MGLRRNRTGRKDTSNVTLLYLRPFDNVSAPKPDDRCAQNCPALPSALHCPCTPIGSSMFALDLLIYALLSERKNETVFSEKTAA